MKKKGIAILGIFSLMALLCVPLTMNVLFYALPNVYSNTFYGAMKGKIDHLRNAQGKKIVVIGGSSVPFSLDSSLIHTYLPDYEPVDFGLYASLGSNLMLDLALPSISSDDIVIVSPELSKQTLSMYYNGLETHKALEQNKETLVSLDRPMRESLLGALPSFLAEKISYLREGIPVPKDIYAASSFNDYGDIKVLRNGNIMLGGVDKNSPIDLEVSLIEEDFIQKLNDFCGDCRKKGAQCYYRFSPMNDAAIRHKENLEAFYDYLDGRLCFDILGDPYEAILEKEWFYDTNFHLNSSGVINWTKQLIKDIKLTLDDLSPTDIALADKPPLIHPHEGKDGNNVDEDCFAYEDQGEECSIVSLAREEASLVVPYRHQGKLVTSFAPSTFQNSRAVTEVTLQDNIRVLYDNSFASSSIQRIIIGNDEPNSISVGDHLLEGSSALIYVAKENLSAYKTSYNWAKYSGVIRALSDE